MATAVNRIVKGYLLKRGFSVVSDDTYSHIEEWLDWYQNDVEKFHKYSVYNGVVMVTSLAEVWIEMQQGAIQRRLHLTKRSLH